MLWFAGILCVAAPGPQNQMGGPGESPQTQLDVLAAADGKFQ